MVTPLAQGQRACHGMHYPAHVSVLQKISGSEFRNPEPLTFLAKFYMRPDKNNTNTTSKTKPRPPLG